MLVHGIPVYLINKQVQTDQLSDHGGSMEKYLFNDAKHYKLMPQNGVKQYVYPLRYTHNAIWDSNAAPDGKLYYGLATEIATAGYVRLCCYDHKTGEVKECFRAEQVILAKDRVIRASKFHSSINFMPDGKIIMTTHTTDKSPKHPTWMPHAYYNHAWEGFAGGNVIIYDPVTNKAENLGIPVPHESIYGSLYEPAHNALWCLGFIRGHLYRFDIDTREVMDFGKMSETYSFRLSPGPDGNIYGASVTGWLYKIDTEKLTVTDLGYQFRYERFEYHTLYNNLTISRTGPDGRMYMACMYTKSLTAFDTKTGLFEDMGPYLTTERYSALENRNCIFGMDFDSEGVLWYVVTSLNNYEDNLEFGIPASLYRWDITRGGKPEWVGVAGTPLRACGWNSEVVITDEDIMYITGSNHSLDGPDLTSVDLKEFRKHIGEYGGELKDRYYDPEAPEYIESAGIIHAQEEDMGANPMNCSLKTAYRPVKLWRALAPDNIENSRVLSLSWKDSSTLTGVCGNSDFFAFEIKNGELLRLEPCEWNEEEGTKQTYEDLPWYPGRQYQAYIAKETALKDGRRFVATGDGMLAVISDDGVYSLGPACVNGPVKAMCTAPDGTVFGVAGYEEDLGNLFMYNEKKGLRWLGVVGCNYGEALTPEDVFYLHDLSCIAVSPDGTKLAIGNRERLGQVVVYKI